MVLQKLDGGGYDYVQNSEPTDPDSGETWLDTSSDPPISNVYADLGGGGGWHRTAAISRILDFVNTDISTLAKGSTLSGLRSENRRQFAELFFDRSMEQLGYDDGWYDILEDESLVESKQNVEGFTGSASVVDSEDYGNFTTPYQDIPFIPNSAVVAETKDITTPVISENGDSVDYEVLPSEEIGEAELIIEGVVNTQDQESTFTELADTDSFSIDIGGNTDADLEIILSGDGDGGDTQWTSGPNTYGPRTAAVMPSLGNLYVGSNNSPVNQYDLETGNRTRIYSHYDNRAIISIDVDNTTELVYAGSEDVGTLIEIDPINETENWRYDTGGNDVTGVAVSETHGLVFVTESYNGVLHAVDVDTENSDWTWKDASSLEAVAVDEDGENVFCADTSNIYSIDLTTGTKQWEKQTATGNPGFELTFDSVNNSLFAPYDYEGVQKLDATDGSIEWSEKIHSQSNGDVIGIGIYPGANTVFAGTGYDIYDIFALDMDDGSEKWRYTEHTNEVFSIAVSEDTGYAYSCDESNDDLRAWTAAGVVTDPEVSIDGEIVSYTGDLSSGEEYSETVTLSPGSKTGDVTLSSGLMEVVADLQEKTVTKDPSITISSGGGSQTISFSGTIDEGNKEDLSSQIDTTQIDGITTMDITISDVTASPIGEAIVSYSHDYFDLWGSLKYELEDRNGNSVILSADSEKTDIGFDSREVRLNIYLQGGLGTLSLEDYGVYLS